MSSIDIGIGKNIISVLNIPEQIIPVLKSASDKRFGEKIKMPRRKKQNRHET